MASNKLELASIAARNSLIAANTYKGTNADTQYSTNHTRGKSDNLTPRYGKGTGNYLDIENYQGGSSVDREGDPAIAMGGGRNAALAMNLGQWGYGPNQHYQKPDTSGNIGQVII